MMNDRRKSDKFVVPEKFLNKPDNVGAERMEGRDLPKENKVEHNTFRTQCREDVLNEFQLIHQRVKSDKYLRERTDVNIQRRSRMR